ncbi:MULTISPECIES: 5-amino-6-(D-ribitylamino)uracil--L-tyrosine 4-hydroxyphenyl transferase CofH [unclassified Archaeoglobus]|jgi:FO synthase subunit 2|uniref:5-amino-6-(D-ribitylamino)uracil--L-tyrosine 4-hydroxyphenyl transferase CofH n=1 Tax=unclassified Archaeoglobus TaxID=2643606 RepID=UPI0025BFF62B|nr:MULTISPECIES: 5-amino-6-(D-ribitylamino)uracil--L-tyrosine 4-hydroxyphenyl transferase CofH [unclassified Archaeoglobus]
MLMAMLALDDLLKNPFETFRIADELRKELVGDTVTYVVNRNINFTDICINDCKFCSFRNRRRYLLSIEEIRRKVEEAVEFGCTEVCIQGGLLPDADLDFYVSILHAVRDVDRKIHIHAFSPMEVVHAARNSGMHVEDVLRTFKKEGLGSMPGTAAEILDDRIRTHICPKKLKTAEWIEVIKLAHKIGIPTTATIMYGHMDGWDERIQHIMLIKKIQQETGGFTEFIPLPFMWRNNELGKHFRGSSGFEDLLMIAISRILLYPEIRNIQASWVKMGLKLAQAALHVGANDLGGTLMEENISKLAGATAGEYLTPEELRELIAVAGRVPRQRDTLYNLIE